MMEDIFYKIIETAIMAIALVFVLAFPVMLLYVLAINFPVVFYITISMAIAVSVFVQSEVD